MTVRRVMGTEIEYGISVPGQPSANPMVTSSQIVNAYGARPELARGGRARWDYEEESPLRDARGFSYSGTLYDPAEALADEDLGLANVILTNGARLYVDHAHPEYSTPEVTNPRDAVLWDKAGERVMAEASRRAATIPGSQPDQPVQEQHRQQGRQLRRARELPDEPADAVRGHRHPSDPVLRHPPDRLRRGPGRASDRTAPVPASSCPSGPTSSRSRSGWKPRSSARSSTPGTSHTPTPTSTAGCT